MKRLNNYLSELFTKPEEIKKKRIVGCGIIGRVVENNKIEILLIQRSKEDHYPHAWELPRGGCMNSDKNSKRCTVREIKEETGLDVKTIKRLGSYKYYRKNDEESDCIIYLCNMINPKQKVVLSHEHQDYKWISSYGQAQLLLHPDQLKFVHWVLTENAEIITIPNFKLSDTDNQRE